jgi:23S rRNA (adenine2503-C2)-methyltransferase
MRTPDSPLSVQDETREDPNLGLPREASDERLALLGRSREELRQLLGDRLDRPFRVQQIHEALHHLGVADFGDITNLPKELRRELSQRFRVGRPEAKERREAPDGTVKYLLRLDDGAGIEAVDIPEGDRRTLCLSSQAGCALGCTFCVTGYWGAGRNLTPGEIVGQWLTIRSHWRGEPRRVNLVFMGMGEPLLNLESLEPALAILAESISPRRITVSTAGVVPGIDAMARWAKRPRLAVSLHAPDDERRSELMPLNRTWPLAELMAALRRWPLEKGERITFEYLLLDRFNDRPEDADAVARLAARLPSKVNLIPMNPDPVLGGLAPPPDEVVDAFQKRLRERGLVATVRRRRGEDVSAACGQLRAFARQPRGAPARRKGT